jgi:hypothetical protein
MILLAGPMIAGPVMTGLVHGRPGFRQFFSRLLAWKAAPRWYWVALLAAPLAVMLVLLPLSVLSKEYLPALFATDNRLTLLLAGIGVGLMGGLMEETGWTGFAVPELRKRFGILTTGLVIGFVWGIWHVPVTFWASGDAVGNLSLALFWPPFVFYMAVLPFFRVLMVWLYDKTESLLLAMLMHGSLTGSTLFVLQPAAEGKGLVFFYIILAAVMGISVFLVTRRESASK